MNFLQQLDAIFTVQAGLVFAVVMICLLCVHAAWVDYTTNKAAVKRMLEEAYDMNDDFDFERALNDEAEAIESGTVVNVVGYCSCKTGMGSFKPFRFTTTRASAEDTQFLDMVAHNHCEVCNPDLNIMLSDEPVVEVVSEHIDGQRVTFTFTDGSTAIMRECAGWGSTRHLDAPSEYGYRVDNGSQHAAIDRYTGSDCIPF